MVSESVELAPFAIAGWQVPGQFPGFATPGWETDDIALKSNVVVAEVVRQEDGFRATAPPGVYPDGEIFTPFEVHVSEILHGSGQPGNLVIIIEGGAAGCEQRSVDIAPKIQVGRRYVLFLSGPVAGYPIVKAWAQAWSIDDSGLVQTLGGPMTIADLRARIDRLAATASPTPSAGSSARP